MTRLKISKLGASCLITTGILAATSISAQQDFYGGQSLPTAQPQTISPIKAKPAVAPRILGPTQNISPLGLSGNRIAPMQMPNAGLNFPYVQGNMVRLVQQPVQVNSHAQHWNQQLIAQPTFIPQQQFIVQPTMRTQIPAVQYLQPQYLVDQQTGPEYLTDQPQIQVVTAPALQEFASVAPQAMIQPKAESAVALQPVRQPSVVNNNYNTIDISVPQQKNAAAVRSNVVQPTVTQPIVQSIPMTSNSCGWMRASERLNLRSGPGTNYPATCVIPRGEAVQCHQCQGGWCRVSYKGKSYWASQAYLR